VFLCCLPLRVPSGQPVEEEDGPQVCVYLLSVCLYLLKRPAILRLFMTA